MYTHQITFGGSTHLFTTRAAAVAFATAHCQLFGSCMRVSAIH